MALSEQDTQKALAQLARTMGGQKNASILLDRLGKNKQFINAIETPAGREIIALVVESIQSAIDNFLKAGITPEQWVELYQKYLELHAVLRFHNKVISKINVYDKDRAQFDSAIGD